MSDSIKELVQTSNAQLGELAAKGGGGLFLTFTAMSVNDWAGLIVAILTGIYMCFQIEAAWHNRKTAKAKRKTAERENQ